MTVPAFLHPLLGSAAEDFITIGSAPAPAMTESAGTEYVDAMASLSYCNVGQDREEEAKHVHWDFSDAPKDWWYPY